MDINSIVEIIKKATKPLRHRVNNMVRLGKVLLVKDGKTQSVQVLTANNEVVENVKFLETYGITSKPISGSETVIFNIQGNATNNVVLNIGNRELRFKSLKDGEVCMYDNSGNIIHLKNGGNMELNSPNSILVKSKDAKVEAEKVNVKATTAEVDATNINLLGDINLGGIGGAKLARIGDSVQVDPITHQGTITSGCTKAGAI